MGISGSLQRPGGPYIEGRTMPGIDARSGVSNPRATTELDAGGSDLAHEEGLATALSAFLSQLHSGFDAPPAMYAPDPGPAVVQALRANRLPSLAARARANKPLPPAFRTGSPVSTLGAGVPQSDAWAAPDPGTKVEAAPGPTATIEAHQSTGAPSPKVDRSAAARAAALVQGGPGRAARTVRNRPVPEIRVDDLPEPWLLSDPTVVNEPTVVSDPTVVNEPPVVNEPTFVSDPIVVNDPTVVSDPTLVNELTTMNDVTTVDVTAVNLPIAEPQPNVPDEPMTLHEQAFLLPPHDDQIMPQNDLRHDLMPQHDDHLIAPAPGASRQRKAAVAGLALAIFAAATLGISVYWGYRTNGTLNQRNQQLAITQASLGAVQDSLTAAQSTLVRQHHDYDALKAGIKQVAEQYVATKTQLAKVQSALGRTQGQLTQAQTQVGRAQNQLGNTQQNLSTTQSHAVQIQRGALLLQQTVQLLASLIVLENNYIAAAQTHNAAGMKSDLTDMRALEDQAQTLEPKSSPPAR